MYYRTAYIEVWSIIARILTKYLKNDEANEHNFKTVKLVLSLPFQYTCLENLEQVYKYNFIYINIFIITYLL